MWPLDNENNNYGLCCVSIGWPWPRPAVVSQLYFSITCRALEKHRGTRPSQTSTVCIPAVRPGGPWFPPSSQGAGRAEAVEEGTAQPRGLSGARNQRHQVECGAGAGGLGPACRWAFLTSSQVMQRLRVLGPHFEKQGSQALFRCNGLKFCLPYFLESLTLRCQH